jgi:hypothetical protein
MTKMIAISFAVVTNINNNLPVALAECPSHAATSKEATLERRMQISMVIPRRMLA